MAADGDNIFARNAAAPLAPIEVSPMQIWITLTEVDVGAVIRTGDPVKVTGPIEVNTDKLVYLRRRHDKMTVVGLDTGEIVMVEEPPEIIHQRRRDALERVGAQLA
jgi:hypothetical protein